MSHKAVKLKEICSFLNGGTPSRKVPRYFEGEIPWITSADLADDQDIVTEARFYITEEAIESSATKNVPKDNILLVSRTGVGKVAITGVDICISQDFTGIVPNKSKVDLRYLFRFLQASKPYFTYYQRGATIQGITRQVIAELEILLPPLAEQQRIASILDKADALRAKRRAGLAKLDTLLQSTFLDIFGDPDSKLPNVKVETLAQDGKGKIRTGPFGSQLLHSEFVDDPDGVMVLGIDNAVQNRFVYTNNRYITHEKYEQLQRYTVNPDDVLITIMGTCGRCSIVPKDIPLAINTKHLCCITLNQEKCLPIYLKYAFLLHPYVLKQLGVSERGAVMPGLNMGIIKDLSVPLPPIEKQQEFVEFVNKMKEQNRLFEGSNEEFDSLFHSLQQRAFKGEL